jgi:hypothetical protein
MTRARESEWRRRLAWLAVHPNEKVRLVDMNLAGSALLQDWLIDMCRRHDQATVHGDECSECTRQTNSTHGQVHVFEVRECGPYNLEVIYRLRKARTPHTTPSS